MANFKPVDTPDPREVAAEIYDLLVDLEDVVSEEVLSRISDLTEVLVRICDDLMLEVLRRG